MLGFSKALKFAGLVAVIALAGCETKPPAQTEAPPVAAPSESNNAVTSNIIPGSAEDLRVNVGDTVHFEYDRYDLRDEDRTVLQRQASWLQKYP